MGLCKIQKNKLKRHITPAYAVPEKSHLWSIMSFLVGLIVIFELHGGNIFGGISAGILSIVGGALGLYYSINQRK